MRVKNYASLGRRIGRWIAEQVRRAGAQGAVFGLSGGVDSAVVGALCRKTLGRERVFGLLLPCHTEEPEMEDARLFAEQFDILLGRVDLTPVFDQLAGLMPSTPPLVQANLKPRLRMLTLYAHANARNALVVGTGNKSELLAGYFTKYGDGGVDLLPLGDLFKTEVWELAKALGIPDKIVTKPPTAGLWPGQTDEAEMGISYRDLDQILRASENGRRAGAGLAPAQVKKVRAMLKKSEHKRAPAAVFRVV